MATRFKDPSRQQIYTLYLSATPPTVSSSFATAYRRGLAGQRAPLRSSLAYASYAAGRDKRRRQKEIENVA